MKRDPRVNLAMLGLALLALPGCESADKEAGMSPGAMAPMDLGGQYSSNFEYLLAKYDADGDRAISAEEYQRDSAQFDRLDRDGDGVIAAADFDRSDGLTRFMARRVLAAHFQKDEPHETLTLDELETSIGQYDADADGTVSRGEFDALAAGRKVALPGDDVPMIQRMAPDDSYATLAGQADDDEDGVLSRDELLAYFDANAAEGAMTIRNPFAGNRRRGAARETETYVEPTDGAMVGDMAPDFALQPPDGGETVTLSSFRKNLPVALIFGSYT